MAGKGHLERGKWWDGTASKAAPEENEKCGCPRFQRGRKESHLRAISRRCSLAVRVGAQLRREHWHWISNHASKLVKRCLRSRPIRSSAVPPALTTSKIPQIWTPLSRNSAYNSQFRLIRHALRRGQKKVHRKHKILARQPPRPQPRLPPQNALLPRLGNGATNQVPRSGRQAPPPARLPRLTRSITWQPN